MLNLEAFPIFLVYWYGTSGGVWWFGAFFGVFLGLGEVFFAFFNAFCTVSWFLTLKGVCFLFQTHSSRFESLVCV